MAIREIDPASGMVPPASTTETTMPQTYIDANGTQFPDDGYDPADPGYDDGYDPETGEVIPSVAPVAPVAQTQGGAPSADAIAALQAQIAALQAGQAAAVTAPQPEVQQPAAPARAPRRRAAAPAEAAAQQPAAQQPATVPLSQQAAPQQQAQVPATTQPNAGAVATADDIPPEVLALYQAKAGAGVNFEGRDMATPRLNLLQDNSPQVKEGTMGYIPGARPGMMIDNVHMRLRSSLLFIPLHFQRRYVAWKARDEKGGGGGLVRPEVPEAEAMSYEADGIGRWVYEDPKHGIVEVVETPSYATLASDDGGRSWDGMMIDMPGTKAKTAGKINTLVASQTIRLPDGSEFMPPIWSTVFELRSKREGEGSEAYFVFDVAIKGRVKNVNLIRKAERLAAQFSAGTVDVAPMTQG